MKARTEAPAEWGKSLRTFLQDEVGNSLGIDNLNFYKQYFYDLFKNQVKNYDLFINISFYI